MGQKKATCQQIEAVFHNKQQQEVSLNRLILLLLIVVGDCG